MKVIGLGYYLNRGNEMEWVSENWEYVLIAIMAVDKAVAMSPSEWDDLVWTSAKKIVFKAVGKDK